MPTVIAQQSVPGGQPGASPRDAALRQGYGLSALLISLVAVVLVCVIALLSWYRRRVIPGGGRVRGRAGAGASRLDPWRESARRLKVEGAEQGEPEEE